MTPDEVVAIKVIEEIREGYHKYGKTYKALTTAISLLQDYQKLRESKDKEIVTLKKRIEELGAEVQGLYDDQAGASL